jgi:hypothetical protein
MSLPWWAWLLNTGVAAVVLWLIELWLRRKDK